MEFICNFSYKNSYLGGLAGVAKKASLRKYFIGVVACTCNPTEIWNGVGLKLVWGNSHSSGWWTV